MNPPCVTNNDVVTGSLVVTDDDHLLLCDYRRDDSNLVAVYYPSGKYMKIIDVSYPPWDIAIVPRAHRAVVTFTNSKIQFSTSPSNMHVSITVDCYFPVTLFIWYCIRKYFSSIPICSVDRTPVSVVLNKGDEIKRPVSVCFNKNCDKLYMANNDSRVVHVYSCSWIELPKPYLCSLRSIAIFLWLSSFGIVYENTSVPSQFTQLIELLLV
jgi:hypothetical protein